MSPEARTILGPEEAWLPCLSGLYCLRPPYDPLLTPQTQVKVID